MKSRSDIIEAYHDSSRFPDFIRRAGRWGVIGAGASSVFSISLIDRLLDFGPAVAEEVAIGGSLATVLGCGALYVLNERRANRVDALPDMMDEALKGLAGTFEATDGSLLNAEELFTRLHAKEPLPTEDLG